LPAGFKASANTGHANKPEADKIMTAEKIKKTKQITTKKQELIVAAKTEYPKATQQQIADMTDTSPAYVNEVLQKYGMIDKTIADYKSYEIQILTGIKEKIISSITDEDYKKASLQQKLTGLGIVHDKISDLQGNDKTTMPLVIINRIQVGKVDQSSYESGQESVIDV
jgi:hypothetical protein